MGLDLWATGALVLIGCGACGGEPKSSLPGATSAAGPHSAMTAPGGSGAAGTTSMLPSATAPAPKATPTGADTGSAAEDAALSFSAVAKPRVTKIGEPAPIEIRVKNTGKEPRFVRDVTTGDGSLALVVTPPGGKPSRVIVGSLFGGAAVQTLNRQVLAGESTAMELDVGLYVPVAAEGAYIVVLEYTWAPGRVWRSPEIQVEKTR